MNTLLDFQVDVAGVVIGTGTQVPLSEISGFGTPAQRTADTDNPVGDGAFPGMDLLSARQVEVEAGIRTPGDPGAALDLLAQLQQVALDQDVRLVPGALAVLRAKMPGRPTRRLYGRVRGVDTATMSDVVHGWIPITITFLATDPTWQDDVQQSLTLPLDITDEPSGFRAPVVAPITTGVSSPAERPGWVNNGGNEATWPHLTITGPCSNPKVWVVETGRYLQLNITLAAGERIDIDTRPGTRWVLLNGSGNASTALTSGSRLDLFTIPPGTSEIRWTATDYTNTARLALSWRDAYTGL